MRERFWRFPHIFAYFHRRLRRVHVASRTRRDDSADSSADFSCMTHVLFVYRFLPVFPEHVSRGLLNLAQKGRKQR